MSLFENFIYKNGEIVDNSWVEWNHESIPNKPKELRDLMRYVLSLAGHWLTCTSLDGCYFVKSNTPPYKLHKNCDCYLTNVKDERVIDSAVAECDSRKFTEYVFTDDTKSKDKLAIFESLGFDRKDSIRLKYEYEKQALKEYLNGDYILKDLDENGQRLAIVISLNGKRFYTGWMVEPEGKIRNTTPFGGWVNG